MKLETEITKTETIKIELETPAFFYCNYRHVKITEEKIIEVNELICIVHSKSDKYGRFAEVANATININEKRETEIEFNAALQSFLNSLK